MKEELLKKDFPPEALSEDKSRGFALTSIKAAFILERLNDVFGIGGWWYDFEPFERIEEEICTVVTLSVMVDSMQPPKPPLQIKQAGGKRIVKGNITDARKSAVTDGLTKCASVLGIGHTIFKGLKTPSQKPSEPQREEVKTKPLAEVLKEILACKDLKKLEKLYKSNAIYFEGNDKTTLIKATDTQKTKLKDKEKTK